MPTLAAAAVLRTSALLLGLDNAVRDYVRALPRVPSREWLTRYEALYTALTTAGVWSRMKLIYLGFNEDEPSALVDFCQPTRRFFNKGASFERAAGHKGDGVSAFVDLVASPSTLGLSQDSATYGANISAGTDAANSNAASIGMQASGNVRILPRSGSGLFSVTLHEPTSISLGASATAMGRRIVTRRGATDVEGYLAGASTATSATASTAVPTSNLTLCRTANTYSDFRVSDAFVCDGISDAEAAAIDAAFAAYVA